MMKDMTAANNNEAEAAAAASSAASAAAGDGAPGPGAAAAAAAGAGGEVDPGDAAAQGPAVADLREKLLRALAEMENLRRRTEREIADSRTYAVTAFARDLIPVADNMRRALEAAGGVILDGPAKSLLDGVELTERELLKVLDRHGVKKFDPQGAKFDPNLHQAMFEVPDSDVPSGSVAQVVQPGYMIGERVLRPAMVGVSKGRPKTAPPERSAQEQPSN